MRAEDAKGLVNVLADAFMRKLEPGTETIYTNTFEGFGSTDLALETVSDLMNNSDRFPSIAAIRATYRAKVQRAIEVKEGQERRAFEEEIVRGGEGLPVMVGQFLQKLQASSTDIVPAKVLVEGEPGACDDCKTPQEHRYCYGAFQLCALCAGLRLAAATKMEA